MDFLRPYFERSLTPLLDCDTVKIAGLAFTGAEIVRSAGDEAYKKAFDQWIWEDWIPTRLERKNKLLELGTNENRYNSLKSMMVGGGATPFIGSGMSVPTGMPTWRNFLQSTRKKAQGFSAADLKKCLNNGDFETAASRIFGAMPSRLFNEHFENSFGVRASQTIDGPVRLLPSLFDSSIITTNFDSIIEKIYQDEGKTFQEILHGSTIANFRTMIATGSRFLLKLHGNYNTTHGRVLLKHEYDDFYDHPGNGRSELSYIFRRGGLLFLGCGLSLDRTMAVLKDIADADASMPRHYAFLQRPASGNQVIKREHFLAARNIFPIWYDGEPNADIEALLVGLMNDLKKL